jgi:excisionase family DNA binding protein
VKAKRQQLVSMTHADGTARDISDCVPWLKPIPALWLTTEQAAVYLGVSARTLEDWRLRRIGPPYYKKQDGKMILYRRYELDNWVEQAYEHIEPRAL